MLSASKKMCFMGRLKLSAQLRMLNSMLSVFLLMPNNNNGSCSRRHSNGRKCSNAPPNAMKKS